ncbi:MAG: CbiX/SirB N-terminal domain-containing protein [Alphaproteobacteria bacterium]|jgi:sirohydrochlorin ferrochelatase|nr:CbiX/SirB N-terminal domain-containing protein [Alphaproteobacteria bacterium]MDP6565237.1 CbiX/SirB N-terminal domain-containing protein [Alphaproteobacteria bacterium]MDP6813613.1 CbiX/SirB N-terminal domain-containing protein [Alphaproteobacteria bacterium]
MARLAASIAPAPASDRAAWSETTLIVVGHGSARDGVGGKVARGHVRALAERRLFAGVELAMLHGEPTLAAALAAAGEGPICLLPFLMADGIVNRRRLPAALADGIGDKADGDRLRLCPPLGLNPGLASLIAGRAGREIERRRWRAGDTALLLVAHGSGRDQASARAAWAQQRAIAALGRFAEVQTAFLEQPPYLDETLASARGPLAGVGLFAGEGQHETVDVADTFAAARGTVVYCGAVGADPGIPDLMLKHLRLAAPLT